MPIPGSVSPALGLQLLDNAVSRATPYEQFLYVSVVFNSTANHDTDIPHTLPVSDPNLVDFSVLNLQLAAAPGTVPVVYRDISGSARAWANNYIVLRSNVASLQCDLLLTVRRVQPKLLS